MKIEKIELKKIEQNENSRAVYKEQDLKDLMTSMKREGLLQPIGVMPIGEKGKYECVFGNRRLVSARKLGWEEIEANVLDIADENSRDVTNLIENMKRQNTTVAEDGRIFQALKDRGLSEGEIAARLDISEDRVRLGIEVLTHVPHEFKRSIVNRLDGVKKPGTISASAAKQILDIRRRHSLTRKQTRSLMHYASQDSTNLSQIGGIAPLIKNGYSVGEAIKAVDKMVRLVLYVFVDEDRMKRLEKQHDKSMTEILWDQIQANKKLGAQKMVPPRFSGKETSVGKVGS